MRDRYEELLRQQRKEDQWTVGLNIMLTIILLLLMTLAGVVIGQWIGGVV